MALPFFLAALFHPGTHAAAGVAGAHVLGAHVAGAHVLGAHVAGAHVLGTHAVGTPVMFGSHTAMTGAAAIDPTVLHHVGGQHLTNALISANVPNSTDPTLIANALVQQMAANQTDPSWLLHNATEVRDALMQSHIPSELANKLVSEAIQEISL